MKASNVMIEGQCIAKYAEASRLAALSHLTLSERERIAFAAGDHATVALIHATEEECADIVSPEHEAMIDDRNRLRDALQECRERMDDAIEQLDTFNAADERIADGASLEFAPAFHDAVTDAEDALERCDEQIDDTLADKLRKAETERDELRKRLAETDANGWKFRELRGMVQFFALKPYVGAYGRDAKPAPKWAQGLIAALDRIEHKP
jgi:chromosome segregation ATPase